ncbi:MAG: beta-propeller domain-containing protein [Filifactor alocis]|nr:beta-propeller domain-containing protein [Filifactor alocis]
MKRKAIRVVLTSLLIMVVLVTTVFAQNRSSSKNLLDKKDLNVYETMKLTTKGDIDNIHSKIVITDKNGKRVPYIVNNNKKKEYLILPLYKNRQEINMKINLNPKEYKIENTDEIVHLNDKQNLKHLSKALEQAQPIMPMTGNFAVSDERVELRREAMVVKESADNGANGGADFSTTNTQVKGVDEADMIKTDGERIYSIFEQKVRIVKATKGVLKEEKSLEFAENLLPLELYVSNKKLSVILSDYRGDSKARTTVYVYDLTKPESPKKIRETTQDGSYITSRKDGDMMRIVTQTHMYSGQIEPMIPVLKESMLGRKETTSTLELNKIMVFPGYQNRSIVTISSFPTDSKTLAKQIAYVGDAQTLYMSKNTMAVSYEIYPWHPWVPLVFDGPNPEVDVVSEDTAEGLKEKITTDIAPEPPIEDTGVKTVIKRFAIKGSDISYVGENKISGILINQFAMDEHKGTLRVAYTNNMIGETSVETFDKSMNRLGTLSGLAKGEMIYSVRFMGDKLYLVTFRQVDPFFVIDMKNASAPKVLGYLKIPGYSTYLHPVNDTYVLGFGYDVKVTGENVRNAGVKISMFDVRDVANPKELSNVVLGKGGSYTPLEYDHKALMYHSDKKYFGFPLVLTDEIPRRDAYGEWMEQKQVFDGAYLYQIDKSYHLQLKGMVTHNKEGQRFQHDYRNRIQRLLYIGDVVYSISENKIMSTNEKDMKLIDVLEWNTK